MTTAVLDSRTDARRQDPEPGFPDLLRSEWTKLTSLRSTWWATGTMIVLALGLNVLITALLTSHWSSLNPGTIADYRNNTVGLVLTAGASWGQIAACVLGVLLMASEFSTGMIHSTVLATPRRTPVLAAKAIVFGGLLFVLGELIAVPSVLIGSSITSAHAHLALTDASTLRAVLCFGLYLALLGVIALGLGTVIRHPAAAISAVVALQFVLPSVFTMLPGSVGRHISGAMPASLYPMMGSGHASNEVYSPLQSALILVGWAAASYLVARLTLAKRDV
ncbi:ABC transporter permease [Streptacidiphilus sp. EB129]|uniref:ABC transporter permease n=1 Tax=Streptacidiphilus sp. EB129 TaxID=3156262 RepID=UPI003513D035